MFFEASVMTIGFPTGLQPCDTTVSTESGPSMVMPMAPVCETLALLTSVLCPAEIAHEAMPPMIGISLLMLLCSLV